MNTPSFDPLITAVKNYNHLKQNIAEIAQKHGRNPDEITLLVASKTQSLEAIHSLYQQGCHHFGESRIQEALPKIDQGASDIVWHFIGTLQENKINKVIGRFALIHSVDTPELAMILSQKSALAGVTTPILLQVNTSKEKSKHGQDEETWLRAFESLLQLPSIQLMGLMTMAPHVEQEIVIRHCFSRLRQFRDLLVKEAGNESILPHLSMGMSHDYPLAIAEGATILRLGRSIFLNHQM